MVKEYDRGPAFDEFLKNVNRLLADKNMREILGELDTEEAEAVSILGPDPAAFMRHRGVKIPEDYRITLEEQVTPFAAPGTGGTGGTGGGKPTRTCWCLRICWWRWCVTICICKIVTTGTTTAIT